MEKDSNQEQITKLWTLVVLLGLLLIGILLIVLSAVVKAYSELWSTILRDIGFVFSPVAVLALLYQYFAQRAHWRYLAKHVASHILKEIRHRLGGQEEVLAIYRRRSAIDFDRFWRSAKQRIQILATNLRSLQMYTGLLVDKAKQGVRVRILALNPTHEFLQRRFKELNLKNPKDFHDEMITSLRHFCNAKENQLGSNEQENFVVKIHDSPPSLMLFRSDDRVILGFILQQGRSSDYMHVEFDCSVQSDRSKYCQDFVDHFEVLWERAAEISSHDLDEIRWSEEATNDLPSQTG